MSPDSGKKSPEDANGVITNQIISECIKDSGCKKNLLKKFPDVYSARGRERGLSAKDFAFSEACLKDSVCKKEFFSLQNEDMRQRNSKAFWDKASSVTNFVYQLVVLGLIIFIVYIVWYLFTSIINPEFWESIGESIGRAFGDQIGDEVLP